MSATDAPWLPKLPARWRTAQLRHVARIRNGADYKAVEVPDGGYPVYGSGGEFRRASDYLFDGESVLFGRKGTIDKPLHVCGRFWTVDTMFYTELELTRIVPRFLYYYATTMPYGLYSTSTALPSMTQGDLAEHVIPLPPRDEQRAIAGYLDRETAKIDTLIEEQHHLIETLHERRRGVLDSAFAESDQSVRTKVRYLLSQRPAYGVLVPEYVNGPGVSFVRVGDILNLDPTASLLKISEEQSTEYSRTRLSGGEVLLGVVGKMGQAAVTPEWLAGANVNRAVAVLRCADLSLAPLLARWLSTSHYFHQASEATSGDSVQATLGMWDLAHFVVHWPTDRSTALRLARRLDEQLTRVDTLIAETERFIELSKERRAALITAAVTGQIDVRQKQGAA